MQMKPPPEEHSPAYELSRRLEKLRAESGKTKKTHAAIAQLLNISRTEVTKYLSGTKIIPRERLESFVRACNGDWEAEKGELERLHAAAEEEQRRLKQGQEPPVRQVALWGPAQSGKTTYLAALSIAVPHASPRLTLSGADEESTRCLSEVADPVADSRCFPAGTQRISTLNLFLAGDGLASPGDPAARLPGSLELSVIDPSGELLRADRPDYSATGELVEHLRLSDGIVFFFDPVRECYVSDWAKHFRTAVRRLEHERAASGGSFPLPHRVSVCVAKLDHPLVFSAARDGGFLVTDTRDPRTLPRIADDRARDFFDLISRKSNPDGGALREMIEGHFRPGRIRYFAVSSAGFHLDESMLFDADDYYNVSEASRNPRLRGPVHPVNVTGPLLWLVAPETYVAACQRHDFTPFHDAAQAPPAGRARPRVKPRPVHFPGPSHLVCMAEISADAMAERRLALLWQLVHRVADINAAQAVSLVSYGPHSFSPGEQEEPVIVHAWAADSTTVIPLLQDLIAREIPRYGWQHQPAAQVECALAEVTHRLSGTRENTAIVTAGSLPPFPSRMAGDSVTLPCPARNDWQAILDSLRQKAGVTLGAIRDTNTWPRHADPARDQIWAQLGVHAMASTDDMDISAFTSRLGLGLNMQPGDR